MKKFDAVVVGELNVDLIFNQIISQPKIGTEILADQMDLTLGSSSAIFASNLSSLGAKVAFIGKIGNDIFGRFILNKLRVKGIDTSMVIQSDKLKTGSTVVLNYDEDRAMITHQGAMAHLTLNDINVEMLRQARHMHFSSYFLQPGLKRDISKLFQLAKETGLTTSFDAQWDPQENWNLDLKTVLPEVDVFLPNEKELFHLTGQCDPTKAINEIKPYANTIIIKQGNKGSMLFHNGVSQHRKAFLNQNVVDAIGAGDSFNAGFIYKYIHKDPMEICQEFGNLIGAISTTAPGGTSTFTSITDIQNIAKEKFGYERNGLTN